MFQHLHSVIRPYCLLFLLLVQVQKNILLLALSLFATTDGFELAFSHFVYTTCRHRVSFKTRLQNNNTSYIYMFIYRLKSIYKCTNYICFHSIWDTLYRSTIDISTLSICLLCRKFSATKTALRTCIILVSNLRTTEIIQNLVDHYYLDLPITAFASNMYTLTNGSGFNTYIVSLIF